MSNITREKAEERRLKVVELLGKGLSVVVIQDTLKETFGFRMNIAKLYRIKNSLKEVTE